MGISRFTGRKTKSMVDSLNKKTYNLKKSFSNKSDEEVGRKTLLFVAAGVGVATVAKKGIGLIKSFCQGVKEGIAEAREEIQAKKKQPEEVILNNNEENKEEKVEDADFTEVK